MRDQTGNRPRPALLGLLLLGLTLPSPAAGLEAPAATGFVESKTFDRWPDPVVADCGLFPALLGKRIDFLRLVAQRDGAFQPIPFQVDEKDARGSIVLLSGKEANPEEANGLLEKGEELVFMARDCGDRVSREVFPPGIELGEELELQDPRSGSKGWVYLLYSESSPPPLSTQSYIRYQPAAACRPEGDCQVMKSRYYECRYYPQRPYFDPSKYPNVGFAHRHTSLTPEAGATGEDFCDRFKVRMTVAFLFGMLKFHVDENQINFYEVAYKEGPVRVIRNNKLVVSLPLGIKAPGAATNIIWYDTMVNVPLLIDIPFNPGYLYSYLEIRISDDHSPEAAGMKVYSSNNPGGCLVDGKTEGEAEERWNSDRDTWRLITGKQGTLMNRSIWDPHYLEQMKSVKVEYLDDDAKGDPPEEVPGMLGMIAQTNRVEGIKKDRYYSYLEYYYVPAFLFSGPGHTYRLGDEKTYLDIADRPIRLSAGKLGMESHYFGQMPPFEEAAATGTEQTTPPQAR